MDHHRPVDLFQLMVILAEPVKSVSIADLLEIACFEEKTWRGLWLLVRPVGVEPTAYTL